MAKRRKKKMSESSPATPKTLSRTALYRIFALIALTIVLLVVYRFLMNTPYFFIAMITYMVVGAAALLGYAVYNRGFSRRGLTIEMLPTDWSDEKKQEFLADGDRRMRRSSWLLIIVFAVFFCFAVDLMELYVIPTISGIFGFSL